MEYYFKLSMQGVMAADKEVAERADDDEVLFFG
jgi:hypothetical protein